MKHSNQEYNSGHGIEGLDRIFNCQQIIHTMLDQHPAIEKFGLQSDVDDVMMSLNLMYTKLANELDIWEENND